MEFHIGGRLRTIIVDNYLPFYKGTNKIAFCKCKSGELWVPILEKCWAKACGSYDWTIGGLCKEAFRALTHAPTKEYLHEYVDKETLWKRLSIGDKNDYVMACTMGADMEYGQDGGNKMKDWGLFTAHAYTLRGAIEVEVS